MRISPDSSSQEAVECVYWCFEAGIKVFAARTAAGVVLIVLI